MVETQFDHLEGISKRHQHPLFPEPEVALIFKKNEFDDPDLDAIESNLKEAVTQVTSNYSVPHNENSILYFSARYNLRGLIAEAGHTAHRHLTHPKCFEQFSLRRQDIIYYVLIPDNELKSKRGINS